MAQSPQSPGFMRLDRLFGNTEGFSDLVLGQPFLAAEAKYKPALLGQGLNRSFYLLSQVIIIEPLLGAVVYVGI